MKLGNPINVRLSLEQQLTYEQQAATVGKPLSTYLRDRLEHQDLILEELASIRRAMHALKDTAKNKEETASATGESILLEILLTLRATASPGKSSVVQKELERAGYNIWVSPAAHQI